MRKGFGQKALKALLIWSQSVIAESKLVGSQKLEKKIFLANDIIYFIFLLKYS